MTSIIFSNFCKILITSCIFSLPRCTKRVDLGALIGWTWWTKMHQKGGPDCTDWACWIMNLIQEAQEEQATNPMTQEELIKEDQRLMRYGQKRAKETGLTEKDIIHEIHAYRAERKS